MRRVRDAATSASPSRWRRHARYLRSSSAGIVSEPATVARLGAAGRVVGRRHERSRTTGYPGGCPSWRHGRAVRALSAAWLGDRSCNLSSSQPPVAQLDLVEFDRRRARSCGGMTKEPSRWPPTQNLIIDDGRLETSWERVTPVEGTDYTARHGQRHRRAADATGRTTVSRISITAGTGGGSITDLELRGVRVQRETREITATGAPDGKPLSVQIWPNVSFNDAEHTAAEWAAFGNTPLRTVSAQLWADGSEDLSLTHDHLLQRRDRRPGARARHRRRRRRGLDRGHLRDGDRRGHHPVRALGILEAPPFPSLKPRSRAPAAARRTMVVEWRPPGRGEPGRVLRPRVAAKPASRTTGRSSRMSRTRTPSTVSPPASTRSGSVR